MATDEEKKRHEQLLQDSEAPVPPDTKDYIKTWIGGAYYRDDWATETSKWVIASDDMNNHEEIFWLDQLLTGGLRVPELQQGGRQRALTILITGPPGTGKSTLAMELCCRLAYMPPNYRSTYFTTEAHPPWVRINAERMFGKGLSNFVGLKMPNDPMGVTVDPKGVTVVPLAVGTPKSFWAGLLDVVDQAARHLRNPPNDAAATYMQNAPQGNVPEAILEPKRPEVLVLDSLNVLSSQKAQAVEFQKFIDQLGHSQSGMKIAIVIVDSQHGEGYRRTEQWEFVCDMVIRLDRTHPRTIAGGYVLRTIEIVKARYQQHAWGPHQIKIYAHRVQDNPLIRHGNRPQGGFAIFPSIHYMLTRAKRAEEAETTDPIETPLTPLTLMLGGGLPPQRCTALIGSRGGHKSHLALMHLLHELRHGHFGIVLSLRDDRGVTDMTMAGILHDWGPKPGEKADVQWERAKAEYELKEYEVKTKQLVQVYFPPGNITPEEFLHIVFLEVKRLKNHRMSTRGTQRITLVFNGLDQLGARFPLCAEVKLFAAALLQMLGGEGVTTIIVAAAEMGETSDYHGLTSIAELIIRFGRRKLERHERANYIESVRWLVEEEKKKAGEIGGERYSSQKEGWHETVEKYLSSEPQPTIITVERQAGGLASGARAVLELVGRKDPFAGIVGVGLQCLPLAVATPQLAEMKQKKQREEIRPH